MIWESGPWKEEIFHISERLRELTERPEWGSELAFQLEKDVFFAAYAIRKLMEAHTLSDVIVESEVEAQIFPVRDGKRVHLLNWHRVDELFDLEEGRRDSVNLRFLCNQIIHSFVFQEFHDENERLSAIGFCSDRERHKCLHLVDVSDLTDLLHTVAYDDPDNISIEWDTDSEGYRTEIRRIRLWSTTGRECYPAPSND